MGKKVNKVILTIAITVALLLFVVLSMGGGHGTFLLAKIIFPYSMFIAIISDGSIGFIEVVLAIIQIPIYAFILHKRPKLLYLIVLLHIVFALICLNLPTEIYN